MRRTILAAFVVVLWALPAMAVDHSAFDRILKAHVKDGLVDYKGLAADKSALADYVASLGSIDASELSRPAKMALYINAYNACTLLMVLDNGGADLKSVQDIPEDKRWKDKRWKIAGKVYSLDEIVNDVLRLQFKDARIHAALNQAAKGSPPMRAEAYNGGRLRKQLDDQTKVWINDRSDVYVKDGVLHLNDVFRQYEDDFKVSAMGAGRFVTHFADAKLKADIEPLGPLPKIEYIEFDWSLNQAG